MSHELLNIDLPADYKPSIGELNNLAYITFKYTVGWRMREADFQVSLLMSGGQDNIAGKDGISNFIMNTCEYAWDHICGEPDQFAPIDLYNHLKPYVEVWYKEYTREERDDTSELTEEEMQQRISEKNSK
jgi:hypothetical protein